MILDTPNKKPRKVVANPIKWKCNFEKQTHQSGESYISRTYISKVKGHKKDYFKCKFKSSTKISNSEWIKLHTSYNALPYNEKRHFITVPSDRVLTWRPKKFTMKGQKIQVCKSFYLGMLDISQKPVYHTYLSKNQETNTPQPDKRGKSCCNRRTTGDPTFVQKHIESMPKDESHYCRSRTKQEYLGSNLSISKLYDLYLEKCKDTSNCPCQTYHV